jgi:hypothetical protein
LLHMCDRRLQSLKSLPVAVVSPRGDWRGEEIMEREAKTARPS